MQVTKEIEVCYSHRLPFHSGDCRNIHGHNSKIKFIFSACDYDADDNSMVADFSYLKNLLTEEVHSVVDHAFVVWDGDMAEYDITLASSVLLCGTPVPSITRVGISLLGFMRSTGMKLLILDRQPTAEVLAEYFGKKLREIINYRQADFRIDSVEWQETSNNTAIWTNDQI